MRKLGIDRSLSGRENERKRREGNVGKGGEERERKKEGRQGIRARDRRTRGSGERQIRLSGHLQFPERASECAGEEGEGGREIRLHRRHEARVHSRSRIKTNVKRREPDGKGLQLRREKGNNALSCERRRNSYAHSSS